MARGVEEAVREGAVGGLCGNRTGTESWASLMAQRVKNLPAMQETWVGKIPWRREWHPTPVFLPGESYGQRSLVGYSSWGCKEPDRTEVTWHALERY